MTNIHVTRRVQARNSSSRRTDSKLPNINAIFFGFLLGIFTTCLTIFMFGTGDITLKIPPIGKKAVVAVAPSPVAEVATVQEPRFDFYTELAKTDVVDTVSDLKSAPKPINGYLVQVGSYKKASDADAMRAKLTLNGYTAKVDQLKQSSGQVIHRVLLGGSKSEANAKKLQQKLKALDIESQLVVKYAD